MKPVTLIYHPSEDPISSVTLPGSKSMAARALIIAACAGRTDFTEISNLPDCDDTRELLSALRRLQESDIDISTRIKGLATSPKYLKVDTGLGGTTLRFFTSLAASLAGVETEIDCDTALRRRPLAPLTEALRQAGARIEYIGNAGYAPLLCHGSALRGGDIEIDTGISSQFISSVMMTAPYWKEGVSIRLKDSESMVSRPYVMMTAAMMRRCGADVRVTADSIAVAPGEYDTIPPRIECDWSAAGYFYEFSLLTGRKILLPSLMSPAESVQGDSRIAEIYGLLGVETGVFGDGLMLSPDKKITESIAASEAVFEFDMTDIPDQVPSLAVAMAMSGIRFRFTGVHHLRHKESDRLLTVTLEMEKLGYRLTYTDDTLGWDGGRLPMGEDETIETHGDHRIAMAMAIAAVCVPYLSMRNPEVVSKSFPGFFKEIDSLGISTSSW